MADIIINGNTFNGNPSSGTLWRPSSIEVETLKIGTSVVAEAGNRTFVQRAVKYKWRIRWEKVNEATRAALAGIAALGATFTFVDMAAVSYTVQTEENDHQQATAFTDKANDVYFDVDLTLWQV